MCSWPRTARRTLPWTRPRTNPDGKVIPVGGEVTSLPDVISGVFLNSNAKIRPGANAGRFSHLYATAEGSGGVALSTEGWGQQAHLAADTLVADLRLDHVDDVADVATSAGISLAGATDSVRLLAAYRHWGLNCFDRVEGDFAAAILDSQSRRLILARDILGNRPLHFRRLEWGTAFASTAAGLACIGGNARADLDAISMMLMSITNLTSRSFLSTVERVLPGHMLIVEADGSSRHERWWKPRLHSVPMSDDEALAAVRDAVDTAVGAALRSDRSTLAAQLSGGHDSTMVVEAAQRLKAPGQRLTAITGRALDPNDDLPHGFFDDTELAQSTAAFLGIDHEVARTAPESVLAVADRLACSDEPLFNPYNLAWFEHTCALAAKAGADVLLTGQSGNLVISPYGLDRLSILARQARLPTLLREWSAYRKRHGASWRGLLAMTLGPWMPERLWAWAAARRGRRHPAPHESALVRLESSSVRGALVHACRTGQARSGTPLRQVGSAARLRIMSWADNGLFNHYIRARHAIEIRDPLGSKRLVELSLMLAPEHFYRHGEVRRLSINLLRGRVPDAVIAERRRGAQGTNWGASAGLALDEMKQEIALIEADRELSDLFDVPQLKKMVEQWPVSRWGDFDVDTTYRASATVALCAARFARRVRERDCGAKIP